MCCKSKRKRLCVIATERQEIMDKDDLDELAKKHDEKWDEVMQLAKQNGFIVQAYAGVATLISNKEQIENYGYEKFQKIQETNNSLENIEVQEM